ncbi:hypothetical protein Tco_0000382 [Tanacetum coccineum]
MRTRSQSRNPNLPQQEASPVIVEPLRIEYPVQDQPQEIPMADNRTMAQLARGIPRGACPHHGFSELHQLDTFYNALNTNDQDSLNSAAGGNFLDKMPRECLKIIESKSKVRQSRSKAVIAKFPTPLPLQGRDSPGTVTNLKEDLKDTYASGTNTTHQRRQPPVVQVQSRNQISKPDVESVSAPKVSIPFPSRRNDENRREKANEQIEKFYEIFKDMNFEISFLDALTLMPKFASTLKALIGNKEKLSEIGKL